jgi:hypothetical protein
MEPQNGRKRSYARQDESHGLEARLLHTLEQLLLLDATSLAETLNAAAQLVGEAVGADKVDLFLHHP